MASLHPSLTEKITSPLITAPSSTKLSSPSLSIKLKYVKLGYHYLISPAFYLLFFCVVFLALNKKGQYAILHHLKLLSSVHGFLLVCLAVAVCASFARRRRPVYMIDFVCYRPDEDRKVSKQYFITNSGLIGLFTAESLDFQRKILERSGLGQETYFPPAVMKMPPNPCLQEARMEAETVMFGALDELLAKTHVELRRIGVLIVNCSAFCPEPSLVAMIINRYKLRSNLAAYNLAGMGCSAGVIAVDMAKQLLSVRRDTYALVLSTENITLNWYRGNEKTMLVSNCLFRMGGSALLLSNLRAMKKKARYELLHTVRTHKAAEDESFFCVKQEEDSAGILGVTLSKELMRVAGGALKTNITTLGPLVLPYSEQMKFLSSFICRFVFKMSMKPYLPDFTRAFHHICVHAGGRAVLDEVEKSLCLPARQMEPSRMTLHRFGNTSSSSIWYELAYAEAKGRIKQNDRVWQIGFGSGFKCNSAVWRALSSIPAESVQNCWSGFIDQYPVRVAAVDKIEVLH